MRRFGQHCGFSLSPVGGFCLGPRRNIHNHATARTHSRHVVSKTVACDIFVTSRPFQLVDPNLVTYFSHKLDILEIRELGTSVGTRDRDSAVKLAANGESEVPVSFA